QIAAANSISDVYAMGGVPKLALNVMCIAKVMDKAVIKEILRGGYDKAAEAGVIITGGHTINGAEPIYGLAVTGFVHPDRVLSNSSAKPGDCLILTKRLGTGILTTARKADESLVSDRLMDRVYRQMSTLNKYAAEVMDRYHVSSCTDVTGFGLMGHCYEMAEGSRTSIHIMASRVPVYAEALEMASYGLVPEGAYRNRRYTEGKIKAYDGLDLSLEDVFYDPQTSGGLLIVLPEDEAKSCLAEMIAEGVDAAMIGFVTEGDDYAIYIDK
ncbi:MAG: selenide, water dikinase SelD, partial [Firmicutes bacterium]|nr:selenide, water dikinase SelD [Bacillota bacterium]MBQ4234486.1 selenide, water dikinase SelD [Bacillota bacterium]